MKKITKRKCEEEAVYYSDFSGKRLSDVGSPVNLKIEFNYGSIYDGSNLSFDLDDEDVEELLLFLKGKLNKRAKEDILREITNNDEEHGYALEVRSWDECSILLCKNALLTQLI